MYKYIVAGVLSLVALPLMSFASDDSQGSASGTITLSQSGTVSTSTGTVGTGTIGITGTGTTGTGTQTWTGSENGMHGIYAGIAQLSQADREALAKIIRDYLTSKGITVVDTETMREEWKDLRKETHEDIKNLRKDLHEEYKATRLSMTVTFNQRRAALKAKREALRAKYKLETSVSGRIDE